MKNKLIVAGLALIALFATTAAQADNFNRRVKIENYTSQTMMYFYASNVDRTSWEEDILGSSVVASGRSIIINIDDRSGYCRFDFRAIFADGSESIRSGVNVCEVGVYTYYD